MKPEVQRARNPLRDTCVAFIATAACICIIIVLVYTMDWYMKYLDAKVVKPLACEVEKQLSETRDPGYPYVDISKMKFDISGNVQVYWYFPKYPHMNPDPGDPTDGMTLVVKGERLCPEGWHLDYDIVNGVHSPKCVIDAPVGMTNRVWTKP